jgi:hypothetical protein
VGLGRAACLDHSAALVVIVSELVRRRRSIQTETVITERWVRNLTQEIRGRLGKLFEQLVEGEDVSRCGDWNRKTDFRRREVAS